MINCDSFAFPLTCSFETGDVVPMPILPAAVMNMRAELLVRNFNDLLSVVPMKLSVVLVPALPNRFHACAFAFSMPVIQAANEIKIIFFMILFFTPLRSFVLHQLQFGQQ